MNITKTKNEYDTFNIKLEDENKVLSINQVGQDLNIACKYNDYRKLSDISFSISIENEELYFPFNKLYSNIVDGNILGEDISLDRVKQTSNLEKNTNLYQKIVQNEVITILSDTTPIDYPNILRIIKEEDKIILKFEKVEAHFRKIPFYIPIDIRTSGSRLYDFSIPFKTLFKELQNLKDKEKYLVKK